MSNFYDKENLETLPTRSLKLLTVMGWHCGLNHTKIEQILNIIKERETNATEKTKEKK